MRNLFYFLILAILVLIVFYSLSGDDQDYLEKVKEAREERIRFLKTSDQSPFRQFGVEFETPEYFEINPSYRVNANLNRIKSPTRLMIQNSDGTSAPYLKFAYAEFTLKDQSLRLLILKPAGFGALPNTYFTAFADNTSGVTTYGGGRYLDLEIGKSNNIVIDFNLAYNPYCAYVTEYSCPLPPAENILPLSVEAGEKDFNH